MHACIQCIFQPVTHSFAIHPFIHQSIHPSIYPSIHPSIHPIIYPFIHSFLRITMNWPYSKYSSTMHSVVNLMKGFKQTPALTLPFTITTHQATKYSRKIRNNPKKSHKIPTKKFQKPQKTNQKNKKIHNASPKN